MVRFAQGATTERLAPVDVIARFGPLGAPGRANCVLGPSFRFGAIMQLWYGEISVFDAPNVRKAVPKRTRPALRLVIRFASRWW